MNEKMIFVVGNSRSGTTMLGRMIAKNPLIHGFPELHLFGPMIPHGKELHLLNREESIKSICWLMDVARNGYHHHRNLAAYQKEAEQLFDGTFESAVNGWQIYYAFVMYEANKQGKTIPCEDLPGNLFKIEQILETFPNAKIIHIIRDPRDVVLSQKNRHQRRKMGGHYVTKLEALRVWSNYHPYVISKMWNSVVSHSSKHNHKNILTVYFEELLKHPSDTLKKICLHLEINYSSLMLEIPQIGSSSKKDNSKQLGVDAGRSGAWQQGGLNHSEIAICEKINATEMVKHGYQLSGAKIGFIQQLYYLLLLPIKASMSIVLNWNRTKGMLHFIIKRFLK